MKWCNFFNKISLILQALGCAVLYFVIEAICRHSFTEAWTYMTTRPLVFAYNAAFIFTTMLIVYLFRKSFLAYLCGQLMAVSGNRKRCASSQPCHTVYRTGCEESDRWSQYCKKISDPYPDDHRCSSSGNCGSDPSDHPDKVAEVQRQAEIQGEYSVGPGRGPCLLRNYTACSGKKSSFQLFWKHCHSL